MELVPRPIGQRTELLRGLRRRLAYLKEWFAVVVYIGLDLVVAPARQAGEVDRGVAQLWCLVLVAEVLHRHAQHSRCRR